MKNFLPCGFTLKHLNTASLKALVFAFSEALEAIGGAFQGSLLDAWFQNAFCAKMQVSPQSQTHFTRCLFGSFFEERGDPFFCFFFGGAGAAFLEGGEGVDAKVVFLRF